MSISYHVYLGPYLECVPKQETKERSYKGCTNKVCRDYKSPLSSQFCPACGTQNGRVLSRTSSEIDLWGVLDLAELTDVMSDVTTAGEDFYFLAPNQTVLDATGLRRRLRRRLFFEATDYVHVDLSKIDMTAELDWFRQKYVEVFDALKPACERMEIRWGIHVYSM